MNQQQIESVLVDANNLREAEKYPESVKEYLAAYLACQQENDFPHLIHALGGISLIYKHLFSTDNDNISLTLCLAYGQEAANVASSHPEIDGRTRSIGFSSFADALLTNRNYPDAQKYFELALSTSTAEKPEKGRLKCHLGYTKYLNGQTEIGLNEIHEGIDDIRTGDMSAYHIRVWETGGLITLAKISLAEGDKVEAEKLLTEAMSIATEHSLTIRQKEINSLHDQI